jgi:hypothetical protein
MWPGREIFCKNFSEKFLENIFGPGKIWENILCGLDDASGKSFEKRLWRFFFERKNFHENNLSGSEFATMRAFWF